MNKLVSLSLEQQCCLLILSILSNVFKNKGDDDLNAPYLNMTLTYLSYPLIHDVDLSFRNEADKQHNESLHVASSIACVDPCVLLSNNPLIFVCDLTDKKERTVNEFIHHLAQVC